MSVYSKNRIYILIHHPPGYDHLESNYESGDPAKKRAIPTSLVHNTIEGCQLTRRSLEAVRHTKENYSRVVFIFH